jgi:hypothetical protein
MDETSLKNDVRLYALEVMVANLWAINLIGSGHPQQFLEQIRHQMMNAARNATVPSADPATSDLLAAELESALDRLLRMVDEQIGVVLRRQQG